MDLRDGRRTSIPGTEIRVEERAPRHATAAGVTEPPEPVTAHVGNDKGGLCVPCMESGFYLNESEAIGLLRQVTCRPRFCKTKTNHYPDKVRCVGKGPKRREP